MSVRNALLGLLAQRPRHGYELRAAFSAVVGGDENWDVKPAQIYTTLDRLEEAGLVARQSDLGEGDEPGRRIYAITTEGDGVLREWFAKGVVPEHQRDEFFVKLMTALVSGEAEMSRLVQTQRSTLYQELHAATTLRDNYNPRTAMAQILLLDKPSCTSKPIYAGSTLPKCAWKRSNGSPCLNRKSARAAAPEKATKARPIHRP
jgi:DNA-binding PadR family transcriptional regulator